MKKLAILLIVFLLFASACTSSPQASSGSLPMPSQWKLVSFGKSGAETAVIQGSTVTLQFAENGQISGSGGCNSYGGRYTMQGNNLSFKEVVHTEMACADNNVTQQEGQFFQALQSASSFELSGGNLTILYDNGQGKLTFAKQ